MKQLALYFEDEIKNVKFFTDNSHRMTHDGGRKPIAICHLSDYGQPINLHLYKDTSIYLNLFSNNLIF